MSFEIIQPGASGGEKTAAQVIDDLRRELAEARELNFAQVGQLNAAANDLIAANEAVRVLAEVAKAATSDEEENFYTNIRRAIIKVNANPIASAAVRAAEGGGA